MQEGIQNPAFAYDFSFYISKLIPYIVIRIINKIELFMRDIHGVVGRVAFCNYFKNVICII